MSSRMKVATSLASPYGLSDEQIHAQFPTIFATQPYHAMSEQYVPLPTFTVLARLREEGFAPTSVMQARTRKEDKRDHVKHLIRFRQVEMLGTRAPGFFEFLMINSSDGSSAYQFLAGWWRTVCSNGLIVGDRLLEVHVPHIRVTLDEIMAATFSIIAQSARVVQVVEEMGQIQTSQQEQLLLAREALSLRYPQIVEGSLAQLLTPDDLLAPRRHEDRKNDLFTVTNRIQENVMKGGIKKTVGYCKTRRTGAVNGISETVSFNTKLYRFADTIRRVHLGLPLEEEAEQGVGETREAALV